MFKGVCGSDRVETGRVSPGQEGSGGVRSRGQEGPSGQLRSPPQAAVLSPEHEEQTQGSTLSRHGPGHAAGDRHKC